MTQQVPLGMTTGVTPAAIGTTPAAIGATALTQMRSHLAGLGLSTPGSSVTFTVNAGIAADSTTTDLIALASSLQKVGNAAWSLGAGGGSLDTGAIANSTWYHVYVIKRVDTGVVDVLTSLSASAPTLPTNYTLFRRIGAMKTTAGGVWQSFTQAGDEFLWSTAVTDVNVANLGSTPTMYTLASVPSGLQMKARVRGYATNATTNTFTVVGSTYETIAPNSPAGSITVSNSAASTSQGATFSLDILTDSAARIQAAASNASTTLVVVTYGWIDRRGRDA